MADIKWSDPPAAMSRHHPGRVLAFVEALKTRPGQWAIYHGSRNRGMSDYFRKKYPGTEATTRRRPDGDADIYVRWVGNGSEPH